MEVKLTNKMNKSGITWILILVGFLITFGGRAFADQIHELAQKGNLEGVKTLIEQNPELVNAKDKDGRTPLHWVCRTFLPEDVKPGIFFPKPLPTA